MYSYNYMSINAYLNTVRKTTTTTTIITIIIKFH